MAKTKPDQFKIWYTLSRSAPDGEYMMVWIYFAVSMGTIKLYLKCACTIVHWCCVVCIAGWAYSKGHVTTDMIRDHLPAAGANVLIMVCGPDAMIQNSCLPGLSVLGHDQKNIVVCD